jgi:hypothetical protein
MAYVFKIQTTFHTDVYIFMAFISIRIDLNSRGMTKSVIAR